MRGRRGFGSWAVVALVVVTTLAATAASHVAQLYAEVYPGQVEVNDLESLDLALANATLQLEFDSQELTENERSRFTARVIYDTELPPGPIVQVAFTNEASLIVTAGQAVLSAVTPTIRDLDEGVPWAGGGLALEWGWDVVPRAIGLLNLELEIQPKLIYGNGFRADGTEKNQPVQVSVDIHPARLAFDEVVAASADLDLVIPDPLTDGVPAKVTASLSLRGHQDVVRASISLATAEGSAPARIEEVDPSPSPRPGEPLVVTWMVTPTEGDINLVFTVDIIAFAGDIELEGSVSATQARRAGPSPPSIWEWMQARAVWLTSILTVLGLLLALDAKYFHLRVRLFRRIRGKAVDRHEKDTAAPANGDL